MEELLRQALPAGHDVWADVALAAQQRRKQLDLCRVLAEPIAALARVWLAEHPGGSMRQLAIRGAKCARRMGYLASHNTIQGILGGHKKRTRGFVYRAMLKQVSGSGDDVPEEHFVPSRWTHGALASVGRPPAKARRPRPAPSASDIIPSGSDTLADYLRAAAGHPLLSPADEARLALGIETAERAALRILVRSAIVPRELGVSETLLEDSIAHGSAPDPIDAVTSRDFAHRMKEALAALDAREALVIRLRYGIGTGRPQTLSDVGREIGVSKQRVHQLEVLALTHLRQSPLVNRLAEYLDAPLPSRVVGRVSRPGGDGAATEQEGIPWPNS
jgi:RNA polymerase sigma factor (sigma-70 family)